MVQKIKPWFPDFPNRNPLLPKPGDGSSVIVTPDDGDDKNPNVPDRPDGDTGYVDVLIYLVMMEDQKIRLTALVVQIKILTN